MSLEDLHLVDEPLPVAIDDLPQEFGVRNPTPQPGYYTFRLPKMDNLEMYKEFAYGKNGNRLEVRFEKGNQLYVDELGYSLFSMRLTNAERSYGAKKGSPLAFLLKALGVTSPLLYSKQYVEELASRSGSMFSARLIWTAFSNPTSLYPNAEGGPKINGNGFRYSSSPYMPSDPAKQKYGTYPVPKVGNIYQSQFVGKAGEELRAYPELTSFAPAV